MRIVDIVGEPKMLGNEISVKNVVRLKRIEFVDFRNIVKGGIEFPCTDMEDIRMNSPSVLGIYGQNGSGKTSVLMALSILKKVLTDNKVGCVEDSYIREGCERCTLSYTFGLYDMASTNSEGEMINSLSAQEEVFYQFDLTSNPKSWLCGEAKSLPETALYVENEVLQTRKYRADGTIAKSKQTLIDTRTVNGDDKSYPFGNKSKYALYVGDSPEAKEELFRLKEETYTGGKSYIFSKDLSMHFANITSPQLRKKKIVSVNGRLIGLFAASNKEDKGTNLLSACFDNRRTDAEREFLNKLQHNQISGAELKNEILTLIHDIDDVLCEENPKHRRYSPPKKMLGDESADSSYEETAIFSRNLTKELWARNMQVAKREDEIGKYKNLISTLKGYGKFCLHIIDTSITGRTNMNTILPLLLWGYREDGNCQTVYSESVNLNMDQETDIDERDFPIVEQSIASINTVLAELIPGLQLGIDDLGTYTDDEDVEKHSFEIQSVRGDVSIPLRYESDGVRRIVSLASLFIAVYNEPSFTLAVDEIDAGIFEYLLGELFQVLSESAQGQFIFTSHNLRPLEVLPAKNLCFTSVNPKNRFVKLRDRGNCNLRDTYFRMIILGSGEDAVYQATDRYKLQRAFLKAGRERAEKE